MLDFDFLGIRVSFSSCVLLYYIFKHFYSNEFSSNIIVGELKTVEYALWGDFIPDLFHEAEDNMPVWEFTKTPVKYAALLLPEPSLYV